MLLEFDFRKYNVILTMSSGYFIDILSPETADVATRYNNNSGFLVRWCFVSSKNINILQYTSYLIS